MATLADIIDDPNYVNANPATKKAIFDKYAPLDPNYNKANAATQEAIRIKFGVAQPRAAEPEGMPGPRVEPPAWAKDYPGLYKAAAQTIIRLMENRKGQFVSSDMAAEGAGAGGGVDTSNPLLAPPAGR